jgi:hypothetical protein
MDFFKSLVEEGNLHYLEELASSKYPIDDDDTPDEMRYLVGLQQSFIETYHKQNNRQFALTKNSLSAYPFPRYKAEAGAYKKRYNIMESKLTVKD